MRGRSKNPNENPGVKPVERIELSEKKPIKRLIAAGILLAIGLGFLGYALSTGLSRETGWTQIEPVSTTGESVAIDLTMLYDLGASGKSAAAEYKAVSALYTELCAKAYRLFHAQYGFEDVQNPYYINHHPGETVTVDPVLYKAFETLEDAQCRVLYAAPFYTQYMNLFQAEEDAFAAQQDPYKNDEIAAYFAELSQFTANPEHVSLSLLGENQVRLNVSEDYLAYAKENGVENFIDFYWLRNAFVVDYIAETMEERGCTYGAVSSYDGFMRVFDNRQTSWTLNLYGKTDPAAYDAARLRYTGKNSLVSLRSFRINDRDETYYTYKTGEERHPYVDPADGLCKSAVSSLVSYGREKSCAQVLLAVLPVYMTDTFAPESLSGLADAQIYGVWFQGTQIRYNDPSVQITDLYRDETVEFTAALEK